MIVAQNISGHTENVKLHHQTVSSHKCQIIKNHGKKPPFFQSKSQPFVKILGIPAASQAPRS
jgi:hypothetical protein